MPGNVQDTITFKFTKTDVTMTHPSGVKTKNTRADIVAAMDGFQRIADDALAAKAAMKADYLDKIDAAPGPVVEPGSLGVGG